MFFYVVGWYNLNKVEVLAEVCECGIICEKAHMRE